MIKQTFKVEVTWDLKKSNKMLEKSIKTAMLNTGINFDSIEQIKISDGKLVQLTVYKAPERKTPKEQGKIWRG